MKKNVRAHCTRFSRAFLYNERMENAEKPLVVRPVSKGDESYAQIRALYKEAFPFKERFSLPALRLAARTRGVDFLAYFDEGQNGRRLVGISYTIAAEGYLYILYLAVEKGLRGGGYGSRILQHVQEQFPGKQLVLEIEPLDKTAENYTQRLSRLGFYERNGFRRVGYDFFEGKVRYTVLATGDTFDAERFARALRKVSHGLYRFKILPASS